MTAVTKKPQEGRIVWNAGNAGCRLRKLPVNNQGEGSRSRSTPKLHLIENLFARLKGSEGRNAQRENGSKIPSNDLRGAKVITHVDSQQALDSFSSFC
ncbi:hypothetical protein [Mesorhizobium sp. M0684]|uniref:hypothetical protein n=1 Tax=unclassified Mesorhizobium TaxID=325217 RepID=UPI00333A2686